MPIPPRKSKVACCSAARLHVRAGVRWRERAARRELVLQLERKDGEP
jgi:hypothetical protein